MHTYVHNQAICNHLLDYTYIQSRSRSKESYEEMRGVAVLARYFSRLPLSSVAVEANSALLGVGPNQKLLIFETENLMVGHY